MRQDLSRYSPFGEWLGRSVVRADAERREVEVHYQAPAEATNRIGTLAGGVLAAMLDSLTGLAALSALPDGVFAVHTALAIDYLRPAAAGVIRGFGRVLELAPPTVRCEGELRDAEDRVVARGRASLRIFPPRSG